MLIWARRAGTTARHRRTICQICEQNHDRLARVPSFEPKTAGGGAPLPAGPGEQPGPADQHRDPERSGAISALRAVILGAVVAIERPHSRCLSCSPSTCQVTRPAHGFRPARRAGAASRSWGDDDLQQLRCTIRGLLPTCPGGAVFASPLPAPGTCGFCDRSHGGGEYWWSLR